MTELIRFSERRRNRPQDLENALVQFHGRRALGTYGGLDIARRRTKEQIGAGLQLSAEIEVGVSALQVIVKVAAAGDYLVDQEVPRIGRSVQLRYLHQMFEDLVLSAGQSVTDGPAERVGDRNVSIWGRPRRQLCRLGLERGQRVGDRPGPIPGCAALRPILGCAGVAG